MKKLSDRFEVALKLTRSDAEKAIIGLVQSHFIDILAALRAHEAEPTLLVNDEIGVISFQTEDCPIVAKPLFPGVHHYIDKLRAFDGRLVGVQFWARSKSPPARPLPPPPKE